MTLTVLDGALIAKDPDATQTYEFDWDTENLPVGVSIATQNTEIIAVRPSTSDTALLLTQSGPGLGILTSGRHVAIQLAGGTLGQIYRITNRITTDEIPFQTKDGSVLMLIEHR